MNLGYIPATQYIRDCNRVGVRLNSRKPPLLAARKVLAVMKAAVHQCLRTRLLRQKRPVDALLKPGPS